MATTTHQDLRATHEPSAAATAVMGAAAGALATWVMDRADWFMWNREGSESRTRTIAVRPGGEPPAHALVSKLEDATGAVLSQGRHEAASQAVHYSIGIAPAIGYAFLRDRLPGTGVVRGILYGVGLFAVQDEAVNTLTGLAAKPQKYPWQAHARGIVAHIVYGATAELSLSAMESWVRGRSSRATRSNGDLAYA